MDPKFNSWLSRYDSERTNPFIIGGKGQLKSSKFDLENMSWIELREIPIPELGDDMTFGKSLHMLKETWTSFKRYKKDGEFRPELALRIIKVQRALGFPEIAEFPELERYGGQAWVDNELAMEEQQSKSYPEDESDQEEEDEGLSKEERQLNQELRKEELTASWGLDDEDEEEQDLW